MCIVFHLSISVSLFQILFIFIDLSLVITHPQHFYQDTVLNGDVLRQTQFQHKQTAYPGELQGDAMSDRFKQLHSRKHVKKKQQKKCGELLFPTEEISHTYTHTHTISEAISVFLPPFLHSQCPQHSEPLHTRG